MPFRHRGNCFAPKALLASRLDSVLCLSPPSALHNRINLRLVRSRISVGRDVDRDADWMNDDHSYRLYALVTLCALVIR